MYLKSDVTQTLATKKHTSKVRNILFIILIMIKLQLILALWSHKLPLPSQSERYFGKECNRPSSGNRVDTATVLSVHLYHRCLVRQGWNEPVIWGSQMRRWVPFVSSADRNSWAPRKFREWLCGCHYKSEEVKVKDRSAYRTGRCAHSVWEGGQRGCWTVKRTILKDLYG